MKFGKHAVYLFIPLAMTIVWGQTTLFTSLQGLERIKKSLNLPVRLDIFAPPPLT